MRNESRASQFARQEQQRARAESQQRYQERMKQAEEKYREEVRILEEQIHASREQMRQSREAMREVPPTTTESYVEADEMLSELRRMNPDWEARRQTALRVRPVTVLGSLYGVRGIDNVAFSGKQNE